MSLRPWAASTTGGIVGPAEGAPRGDARLRLLLQLGAEKARQERVARERAVPVPTDMHHAEKRKERTLPNWMLPPGHPKRKKEEQEEQEETNDADDDMDDDEPGTPPRPLHEGFRLYNDGSIFRVTLSANQFDPGPATFSGPFWQRVQSATTVFPPPEEPRPSLFGGAEPPPPPAAPAAQLDRSRRTYREFFRLGFGTFLNAYTAEHVDVNDLLRMPEQDNAAGTNFLEVSERLMEQVTTVEAWRDLPASLTISCGSEGVVVRQPQTIRFANVPMYVRDPSKNVSGAYEIDFLFPDAGVEGVMAGRGYNSLLSAAAGSFFSWR